MHSGGRQGRAGRGPARAHVVQVLEAERAAGAPRVGQRAGQAVAAQVQQHEQREAVLGRPRARQRPAHARPAQRERAQLRPRRQRAPVVRQRACPRRSPSCWESKTSMELSLPCLQTVLAARPPQRSARSCAGSAPAMRWLSSSVSACCAACFGRYILLVVLLLNNQEKYHICPVW